MAGLDGLKRIVPLILIVRILGLIPLPSDPLDVTMKPGTKGWDDLDGRVHGTEPSSLVAWVHPDLWQVPWTSFERAATAGPTQQRLPGQRAQIGARGDRHRWSGVRGQLMTAVVAVAIMVIFIIGMITGVVVLVSVASHREDKRLRLSREAPDRTALAGRYLTSLYVRRPGDDGIPQDQPDDQQAKMLGWPHRGPSGLTR